jgi:hypothetical protein
MTTPTPERFTVLSGGRTGEERDERLQHGADELATKRARRGLLGNERILLILAGGLMSFGVCVILLGWYGAAHSTLTEEQLPYLISGGILGAALALIGAVCLLAHWLTVLIREARAREVVRRQDHAELMAALTRREANRGGRARGT